MNGETRMGVFAWTDIAEGEELTFDYNWESIGTDLKKCSCGAHNCRGFLGAKKQKLVKTSSSLNGMRGRKKKEKKEKEQERVLSKIGNGKVEFRKGNSRRNTVTKNILISESEEEEEEEKEEEEKEVEEEEEEGDEEEKDEEDEEEEGTVDDDMNNVAESIQGNNWNGIFSRTHSGWECRLQHNLASGITNLASTTVLEQNRNHGNDGENIISKKEKEEGKERGKVSSPFLLKRNIRRLQMDWQAAYDTFLCTQIEEASKSRGRRGRKVSSSSFSRSLSSPSSSSLRFEERRSKLIEKLKLAQGPKENRWQDRMMVKGLTRSSGEVEENFVTVMRRIALREVSSIVEGEQDVERGEKAEETESVREKEEAGNKLQRSKGRRGRNSKVAKRKETFVQFRKSQWTWGDTCAAHYQQEMYDERWRK